MKGGRFTPWLLASVAAISFFANLGGARLWDRDEPRNAGCAVEMLQANDWITPRFNAEVRSHKPVLLYWLMMTSYAVLGVSEFSARFFSAALSVVGVLLTYDMGRRLLNREAAFWGALALATSLMFAMAARIATPDALLIFTVTLAMWTYVWGVGDWSDPETKYYPQSWWKLTLLYGAMGLAMLAKGPIGLVLPTAIIGMFLLIQRLPEETATGWRRWLTPLRPFAPLHFLKTVWFMRPLLALAAALVVALPWYLWVAVREFAWIRGFFWEHNLGRATAAMEGHQGPFIFYIVAICIGFFPWSIFFVPTILDLTAQIRRRAKEMPGLIFLACWCCVWITLFTIAKTKLPSYVTPCYPALALLVGATLARFVSGETEVSRRWNFAGFAISIVVGLGFLIGAPLALDQVIPGEAILAIVGIAPLVGGIAAIYFSSRNQTGVGLGVYGGASLAFVLLLFAFAAQRVDRHQLNESIITILRDSSDEELFAYNALEPSWIFYSGRSIQEIQGDEQLLQQEIAASPAPLIVTTRGQYEMLSDQTRKQLPVVESVPYFLRKEELIVIAPSDSPLAKMAALRNSDAR
ncbi:glycosyltransferase family 39 protein [Blastopirellula sp. JC732]|uniref:Glycosyltransferase family 39 protein n=1 Tax=Blastopirellula sediminis TaxID=2894196 RepID=A0A9X1SE38_9BACT|nr:glycosyltransferase family 39 protein [Blastopirellula sediminis]MCC9607867.1 glycosyltransferase family 39 protein [Blastopirellula sediminis]MCC9627340.1 glycosyltransferase family 39 protein [Blastopirellula sediminis]